MPTLQPIFETCRPRADVEAGTTKDEQFAADLAQVVNGTAPKEYAESALFFRHSYPTRGMRELLKAVLTRLSGRGGEISSIIRLDTQYGGGIATAILVHDESQIEYYEQITKDMVGRVLRKRGVVEKDGRTFELLDFDSLAPEQVADLIGQCEQKLAEFKERRGAKIWQHRKLSEGYISGTIRYEILKRAKFRCELCGVSAEVKALEVDHIVPRSKGGTDDESNLQALCYSHNAMKRDRDDTDFRKVIESYRHREPGCVFCEVPAERIVVQNELCVALRDKYPVTPGHALVVPRRHVADYFDLGRPELNAVHFLLEKLKRQIQADDPRMKGFNVGINCGQAAGQTVFHCHVHLIPRREGDVDNPAGGVRHLIPGRGYYPTTSAAVERVHADDAIPDKRGEEVVR